MIRQPSSIIVTGPSGSGKTVLVESLLRHPKRLFAERPKKIVYTYDRWQPRFDIMKRRDGIYFFNGIPEPSHFTKWFDQKGVLDLFTKDSHHRNVTVFYLTQDFPPHRQICEDHQPQRTLSHCLQESTGSNRITKRATPSISTMMAFYTSII